MNNEQPSTSSDTLGLDRVTSETTWNPIRTRRTPHSKEVLKSNWLTSDGWAESDSGPCTKDPSFLWNGRWRRWTAERSKFRCYHLFLIIPAIFLILLWLILNPIWPPGWYCSTKIGTSDQAISSESYNVIDDPKLMWVFNAHEFRRSQQKQNPRLLLRKRRSAESPVSFGLAEECGQKCSIRLKASDITGSTDVQKHKLKVNFYRTSSLIPEIPLVQFMDSENNTHARSSSASSNCLYYAKVADSKESSVVNLCDKNGGVFGTLALYEGTFAIEPIENSAEDDDADSPSLETSKSRRRRRSTLLPNARAHRIYQIKSHSFEKPLSNDKLFSSFNDTAVFSASPKTTFSSLPFDATANFTLFSSTASRDDDLNNSSFISQNGNYLQFDSRTFRRRRSKRFANSWDNYVEVLVVADYKMLLYHQMNLENYVLTLFSTVASIYRHPSLGASINIVVVRLIILKHETAGPRISNRAQETLQQFCTWQQNYNDGNDDAINHHDVAILLTRHDICRASNKCDTLGLAELGTMCDSVKSCAIIEDNGLSAAFTIAHELGHIFNIPHDDERKCAEFMPLNKNNYHIMAPTLEYNTNPWSWSPCSSHMLAKFLDSSRAQTQCILDQPVERRYFTKMFEYTAPGSMYSVNQQCQFVFGPSAEICPYMPTCRRLWCSVSYGYQMGCRTQHMPWADGTPCGDNRWCHRGHCVGMSPSQRPKQDGGWGEWKPWKECSRTCGGGIQKAERDCDTPRPSNGGKYCLGQRVRYRSCNIQECPYDTIGFREMQCSEFDGRDVKIHGVPNDTKWVPKYTGISENERCSLYCQASNSAAFYLLKEKVLDGTTCDRNSDDICIDGVCHKAGCDHRLGSDMKRDICGICGGDSKSCTTMQGTYNERGSFGYNEVLKIPAGSANIDIRQSAYNDQKDDDNYLALRGSNGEFLLNGHYQVSVFRQQIAIFDTVLDYSGSDHAVERINGTGPLRTDVYLHILSVGNLNPPNIHYKYMVSNRASSPQQTVTNYYWRFSEGWSECTAKCQGNQVQILICVDAVTNRHVRDKHCEKIPKPDAHQRMCNVDCFYKWQHVSINHIKDADGPYVMCIRAFTDGREERAHDEECQAAGLARPSHRHCRDCNNQRFRWTYSEWSQCSESCGTKGISRRGAQCVDSANRQIDNRFCEGITREPTETECNRVPCPKWNFGSWSECSRSCGGGLRIRLAQCQDASGRDVSGDLCPVSEKVDREKCNEHLCKQWKFGSWSQCSVSCGIGIEKRDARCVDQNGQVLGDDQCAPQERIVEKQCTKPACPHWKMTSWSSCSVSCMDGFETRSVTCVDGNDHKLPDQRCLKKGELKPPSHRPCSYGPCPYWKASELSDCSVTCGTGVREREVECIYREQIVDDSLCPDRQRPPKQEQCVLLPCAQWKTEPWGTCSVSCGMGIQRRTVHCTRTGSNQRSIEVHDTECQGHKPKTERDCERMPCPILPRKIDATPEKSASSIHWAIGSWGDCSKTCGRGIQRRLVQCRDQIRLLPAEYCRHLKTVISEQECELSSCFEWTVGPWEKCNATCGEYATQTRRISCDPIPINGALITNNNVENVVIDGSKCNFAKKPVDTRKCDVPACPPRTNPKASVWEIGDWSECSATCGGGWRRRSVYCSKSRCPESEKPSMFEQCNTKPCRIGQWRLGPWTHCSVTCGDGVQTRKVWCQSDINVLQTLEDSECDVSERPIPLRNCSRSSCPVSQRINATSLNDSSNSTQMQNIAIDSQIENNLVNDGIMAGSYNWIPGQWSPCSQTCGRGIRTRTVKCVDSTGTEVSHSKCDISLRPLQQHKCRQAHCPRWHANKWSTCSATCGPGISRRDIICKKGRTEVPDTLCSHLAKLYETKKCEIAKCTKYVWRVTPWSKCIDPCKATEQGRRVYCMSNANKRASNKMCNSTSMPATKRKCLVTQCPYEWMPGPWSTCSRTCGNGFQFRKIECKVRRAVHSKNSTNVVGSEPTVLSRMCLSLDKPQVSKECNLGPCGVDASYRWSVGPWSHCSKSCGPGFRKRKIRCMDKSGERISRELCDQTKRPRRREPCFVRNCLPNDCAELRAQNTTAQGIDGNYTVLVAGFRVNVYCHAMNSTLPKTYLNVNPHTNFAEFYGKRLSYPYSCPFEGRRNDSCACTNDGHASSGLSHFKKLRIDLHNMKINPNDFTFAHTEYGNPVPFGSAGDCYSMSECPQGRFSIDLRLTGLRVVDDLQWVDQGYRTSSRIERKENNALIEGQCGGYCGECAPDRFKGLVIEVDLKQKPSVGVG